jgi:hypothetical protein
MQKTLALSRICGINEVIPDWPPGVRPWRCGPSYAARAFTHRRGEGSNS